VVEGPTTWGPRPALSVVVHCDTSAFGPVATVEAAELGFESSERGDRHGVVARRPYSAQVPMRRLAVRDDALRPTTQEQRGSQATSGCAATR